jgi:hypothetical protein
MAIGAGAAKRLAPISVIGMFANLALTVWLAREFGLAGSAAATSVVVAVEFPLMLVVIGRIFDIGPMAFLRSSASPVALGFAIGAACLTLNSRFTDDVTSIAAGVVTTSALAIGYAALHRPRLVSFARELRRS